MPATTGAARVLLPGEGEVVGDSPERRVEILSDVPPLSATWSRFAAGRDGADLHVHRRHSDLFHVLDGELTLRLGAGGDPVTVRPGTLARVPPLVVHGFRNAGGADVRSLDLHAPGERFAAYLRGLRDGRPVAYVQEPPPADGGRPPAEVVIGGAERVVDRPGLRIDLLADVAEVAVAETWSAPGTGVPPARLDAPRVESCFVLLGELSLEVDGRTLLAPAGAWVQVAPGVAWSAAATGPEPVRCLAVHTPGCGLGGWLRALAA